MEAEAEAKGEQEEKLLHWEKTYEFDWEEVLSNEDRRTVILWAFDPDLEKVEFDSTDDGYRIMLGDEVIMESGYFFEETCKLVRKLHDMGAEYASLRIEKWEVPAGIAIYSLYKWWPTGHLDYDTGHFGRDTFRVRFEMEIPATTVKEAAPYFHDHDVNVGTFYQALFRLLVRKVADAKKEGRLDEVHEAKIETSCRMLKVDKEQVACPVDMGKPQPEDE